MSTRRRYVSFLAHALLGAAGLLAGSSAAEAQVPQPEVPEMDKRSGQVNRFVRINPNLPPDPRRDNWYDTRWGDSPNERAHPNWYHNGGLYGLRWWAKDTKSFYPYFYGSPGKGTVTPESYRWLKPLRYAQGFIKPFKPVGMYYDQGSYVPIYDLDPVVPGPGSYPWPFFPKITAIGG